MKNLLAAGTLFFSLLPILAQGTPDGKTPANEGVCNDLVLATPGLYGLCVAFCEAQDCEPNFSAMDPFQNCRPSNPKLLKIYNRRKRPNDPPMPCFLPQCPCFNEQEVREITPPWSESPVGEWIGCSAESPEVAIWHDSQPIGAWWRTAWTNENDPQRGDECFYDKYLGGPFPDNYVVRYHSLLPANNIIACRSLVKDWIAENGGCEGNTEPRSE